MSRHSKNNTAHSVFTYAEKKMLDRDYGTKKTRISQDSQRSFEQCFLCLNLARDPMACLKGHMFWRTWIMDNMLAQKKNIAEDTKNYEKEKEKGEMREFLKKRKLNEAEISEFEKDAFEMGNLKKLKAHQMEYTIKSKFTEKDIENLKKEQTLNRIKTKTTLGFDNFELKKDLIQTSFWMAESDRDRLNLLDSTKLALEDKKPSGKMKCPGDNFHTLKLKELFRMNFDDMKHFICYASKKQLKFQQVVCLRT